MLCSRAHHFWIFDGIQGWKKHSLVHGLTQQKSGVSENGVAHNGQGVDFQKLHISSFYLFISSQQNKDAAEIC